MAIDGTYKIKAKTPMGVQESTKTLKTDGNVLSGTSVSSTGTNSITNGTVNGNEIQWEEEVNTPMGKMKLNMKATVAGDKISGTASTPMGAIPFEGTRI